MKKSRSVLVWFLTIVIVLGGIGGIRALTSMGTINRSPNQLVSAKQNNIALVSAKTKSSMAEVKKTKTEEMKVHFLDVGQADCILIESNGKYMLVDAGNSEDEDEITDYLDKLHVKKLEYVIATHPHEDHIGSMDRIVEKYEIGTLIMPGKAHTTETFQNLLTAIENKGLKITAPVVGDVYTLGAADFTILSPNKDYGDELNDWSVGIRLTNGKNSFVLCGDAEEAAEQDILQNKQELKSDVLKIGHHGSSSSSSEAFLDAVDPQFAVISCEKNNDYGHPTKETLDKLAKHDIKIFRTDEQGTITAVSDGNEIVWNNIPSTTLAAGTVKQGKGDVQEKNVLEDKNGQQKAQAASDYIININTGKFHKPSCASVNKMKESNKKTYNGNKDDLINQGYSPCKNCNP